MHTPAEAIERTEAFIAAHPQGVISIVGPTGSGKTALSIAVGQALRSAAVISIDSRQIYQQLDVGTGKILPEEQRGLPHYGLSLLPVTKRWNAYTAQQYVLERISALQQAGTTPVLCGGTMLWSDAVTEGYVFAERGEKSLERQVPPFPVRKLITWWPREQLYERINERCQQMWAGGMLSECAWLMTQPVVDKAVITSIGYAEGMAYLRGLSTEHEARERFQQRSRHYAKRQLTWWRGRSDLEWVDMRGFSAKEKV
ncbi:hypothetical protein H6771_00340 [Candidatus Peribacteria bacterium]|nr:hypothetical protein [Candidatus Peribacteria bacterium]